MTFYLGNTTAEEVFAQNIICCHGNCLQTAELLSQCNHVQRQLLESVEVYMKTWIMTTQNTVSSDQDPLDLRI